MELLQGKSIRVHPVTALESVGLLTDPSLNSRLTRAFRIEVDPFSRTFKSARIGVNQVAVAFDEIEEGRPEANLYCAVGALICTLDSRVQSLNPQGFDSDLKRNLRKSIVLASKKIQGDVRQKQLAQKAVQTMLNSGFLMNASKTFTYCQDGSPQRVEGFEVFSSLFPSFYSLLNSPIDTNRVRTNASIIFGSRWENAYKITARYRGDSKSHTVAEWMDQALQARDRISLPELVRSIVRLVGTSGNRELLNLPEVQNELRLLANNNSEVVNLLDQMRRNPVIQRNEQKKPARPVFSYKERGKNEKKQIPFLKGFPDVRGREYGFRIDEELTHMMRELTHDEQAIVLPIEEIRRNPKGFYEYQKALVNTIEAHLTQNGTEIDPRDLLRRIREGKINASQELASLLIDNTTWQWKLLYPQIQNEFFKRLPYSGLPPYAIENGVPVPIWKAQKDSKLVNQLQFFNYVVRHSSGHRDVDATIPGLYLQHVHQKGGIAFIDHAVARFLYAGWELNPPITQAEYSSRTEDETQRYPRLDVDMLILGKDVSPGRIAVDVALQWNSAYHQSDIHGGPIQGSSMNGVTWAYVAKPTVAEIMNHPKRASQDPSCMIHALKAWRPGEMREATKLVEVLLGLSRFRSIGFVADIIHTHNRTVVALRPVDIFGGLVEYAELSGGGVLFEHNGEKSKRNGIGFFSMDKAFPRNQSISVWHILRTVEDIMHSTHPGVFLREGLVAQSTQHPQYAVSEGAFQMREKVMQIAQDFQTIVAKSDPHVTRPDLLHELTTTANELIDKNPYEFLVLCSGEELEYNPDLLDEERGIYGIELRRLYPHLNVFAENKEQWVELLRKVKENKRMENETALHFLARTILEMEGGRAKIEASIEHELFHNPNLIGPRLFQIGELDGRDWGVLNIDLGSLIALQGEKIWTLLMLQIKKGGVTSLDELQSRMFFSLDGSLIDRDRTAKRKRKMLSDIYEDNKHFKERQINALSDWLLAQNF